MTATTFPPLTQEKIFEKLEEFNRLLHTFSDWLGYETNGLSISIPYLVDVFIEVEKEKERISLYEKSIHISEIREVSLYCYFILKKRPVVANNAKPDLLTKNVNETFCIYFLMCVIAASKNFCREGGEIFPEAYIKHLMKIFANGDLSKDAIFLLAFTLQTFCKGEA